MSPEDREHMQRISRLRILVAVTANFDAFLQKSVAEQIAHRQQLLEMWVWCKDKNLWQHCDELQEQIDQINHSFAGRYVELASEGGR